MGADLKYSPINPCIFLNMKVRKIMRIRYMCQELSFPPQFLSLCLSLSLSVSLQWVQCTYSSICTHVCLGLLLETLILKCFTLRIQLRLKCSF